MGEKSKRLGKEPIRKVMRLGIKKLLRDGHWPQNTPHGRAGRYAPYYVAAIGKEEYARRYGRLKRKKEKIE